MYILNFLASLILQVNFSSQELLNFVQNFQNNEKMRSSMVALSIKSCRTQESLVEYNSEKSLPTASTLKLITTATALENLGKSFRFQTKVNYSGNIDNQVLKGDIFIIGEGDPSFGSNRFDKNSTKILEEIRLTLLKNGIKKIVGKIYLIDSSFQNYDISDTWAWNDMGNYYGAIPYGLNFNENQFSVFFSTDKLLNKPARISKIEPFDKNWQFINLVTSDKIGSGDQTYFYSTPLSSVILMKGTLPINELNFEVKGSIPNPAKTFGEVLKFDLEKNGISVSGETILTSEIPISTEPLLIFDSKNLFELAQACNFESINLYADAFLKFLGLKFNGEFTYKAGIAFLKNYWKLRGINVEKLNIKDGCGLSPQTIVPPELMTKLLAEEASSSNFMDFYSTIPIVGMHGTVKNTAKNSKANGNVRAKSGSIEGTRAFSGYFTSKNGELMSFMVIVSHFDENEKSNVRNFLSQCLHKIVEI